MTPSRVVASSRASAAVRQPRRRFHCRSRARRSAEQPAAASATPEINAWVVVQPDDTVVIRIARSEMGRAR
jgi:isoquinoline 1-oxidoreductase beta subunit